MTEPTSAFRCSDAARARNDRPIGTAPPARRWLLLEHPGPWRADALAGSGIDPAVLSALARAAQRAGARILLIRRPGRTTRAPRRWILASLGGSTVSGPWAQDQDLRAAVIALGEPPPPAGPPERLILVCAHGVHDVCCAVRGRPVAAALTEYWPNQVWECSHVGGDRFAPNVVVLPDGYYYGNLDPTSAVASIGDHLRGLVRADHLRGMARFPPAVQAAVGAAYARLGPLPLDAVTVQALDRHPPHAGHGSVTVVDLEITGRPDRVQVQVLATRLPEAQLTCRAARATPATGYQIERFTVRS